ncbi:MULTISPECIES: Hint domain-containing protein [Sulfitobacter]|mgnify:FL=1|uniref:Hint domain-containing protein n=1 Tax=Sulfitobacter TaxID=60136 RepID=UPI000E980DDE|nr:MULTISPECIES: Hint domain-containing protein [Sulfitobacter]HAR81104.1 type I secretion protein [Sulfitobacter pontiacus]|tara:strand:- start:1658 stop:4927 length:3270 start_codon:yes stop_codon:yes gene_type:complete
MATRFNVFYLGNVGRIDTTEGNQISENARSLEGETFGGANSPLYNNIKSFSPGARGYGNTARGTYSTDNSGENGSDTFRIDDGNSQNFDAIASYAATLTYADGSQATVTAIVFQSTNGDLFLAPAASSSDYQSALEAGPIDSITFNTVSSNEAMMYASRVDADYVAPDGTVDGTSGDDSMRVGSTDAQADEVDNSGNAIKLGAGNDKISAGSGDDTILGGAGNDYIAGNDGDDRLHGDADTTEETTFSWANQNIEDGVSVTGGITGVTSSGNIQVTMSVDQGENFRSATMERNDPLYDYNELSDSSSIHILGGAAGSDPNTAKMSIDFSSLDSGVSDEVSNVTFGIFDIDQAYGFVDEVIVRAYDADGNLIPVNLTAGNSDTLDVNDETGRAISTDAGRGTTNAKTGFLQVDIAGPVSRIEIEYNNHDPDDTGHAIRVGDLKMSTISATDAGNDTLDGGAGSDTIYGDGGNDSLSGGADNDSLSGGSGDDRIEGGTGHDTIAGGTGNDAMSGGDDADLFVMEDDFGTDKIAGGEGGKDYDVVTFDALSNGVSVTYTGEEAGTATEGPNSVSFTEIEKLVLTNSSDYVDASIGGVAVDTGAGNDTIKVGDGAYDIDAGTGDDRIIREAGTTADDANSVIDAGDGIDTYVAGSGLGADHTVDLAASRLDHAGNDRGDLLNFENVALENSAASVKGDSKDNTITARGTQDNSLSGGDGNDSIDGGGGNDNLHGDAGRDTLIGGDGNDTLDGGQGDDQLTGGDGDDVFVYSGGHDTITDFNAGNTGPLDDNDTTNNDFIDLSGYYDKIFDLRADYEDNGILDQSNFETTDYTYNSKFEDGSLKFIGVQAQHFTYDNTGVVCFGKGTAIRTPRGDVLVEDLRVGDLVTTMDNGPQKIRWINTRSYDARQMQKGSHLHPVLIKRGTFGAERDLLVSQQHGVLVGQSGDSFARAKHLADAAKGVRIAKGKKSVTYVHLMFDDHQVIFAENVPSESFYPGPMALSQMSKPHRAAFSKVLPALGTGRVSREEVAKIYGPTARVFLKKKQVLNQHGVPARGKGKTPSRLILQASADLAQQQATKAIRTRNTVTTAEARA